MLSEVFKEGYDGKKCDMWSLGVTFYCILFGTLPFQDDLLLKLFEQIEQGKYEIPACLNPAFEVLVPVIGLLIKVNPDERMNAGELE